MPLKNKGKHLRIEARAFSEVLALMPLKRVTEGKIRKNLKLQLGFEEAWVKSTVCPRVSGKAF